MFVSIFRLVSSCCTCTPGYDGSTLTLLWSPCPFFGPSLTFLHRLTSLTSGAPIAISLPASWMFVGWLYRVCCSYFSNHRYAPTQPDTSMLLEKRVSRVFRPSRRIGTESAQLDSLVLIHSSAHRTEYILATYLVLLVNSSCIIWCTVWYPLKDWELWVEFVVIDQHWKGVSGGRDEWIYNLVDQVTSMNWASVINNQLWRFSGKYIRAIICQYSAKAWTVT